MHRLQATTTATKTKTKARWRTRRTSKKLNKIDAKAFFLIISWKHIFMHIYECVVLCVIFSLKEDDEDEDEEEEVV